MMPEIVSYSAQAGGSLVTSYVLEYNRGSGSVFFEVTGFTVEQLERTIIVQGTPGVTYTFRYTIKNILGFSIGYSPETVIKCAKAPAAPVIVTTTIIGKNVVIQWTPSSDNFDRVIRFEIEIKSFTGVWLQSTLTCDGSSAQIRQDNQCSVPLVTLIQVYNLKQGNYVEVRIASTNTIGTSNYTYSTGVYIQTVPLTPIAPTLGQNSSYQHIQIVWEPITNLTLTGGLPILSYKLDWDAGTNQVVWTTLVGLNQAYLGTSWTQGGCIPGTVYYIRLSV
jgi:hypothetical protein